MGVVVNLARRDANPKTTFRRVRSTIEILGAKQPREVLDWIVKSVGVGNVSVNAGWWDVQVIVERARVALVIGDGDDWGDDPGVFTRALDEIVSTCNYHLNVQ